MRSSQIAKTASILLLLLLSSYLHAANPWYHIGAAKKLADGSPVTFTNLVATCGSTDLPGRVYVQEAGTRCGIWVQTAQTVGRGASCGGYGTIRTDAATGERYLSGTLTSAAVQTQPKPMGMPLSSLGGGPLGTPPAAQLGIAGASGVNNIGLLVRVWGKVTSVGLDYVYLDDGSGLKDGTLAGSSESLGVRIATTSRDYSIGDKLEVTGISSCFKLSSRPVRRILTRDSDDIRRILPPVDQLFTPNYVPALGGNLFHWDHLPVTVSFNLPPEWATIYASQPDVHVQAANEWNPGCQQAMVQVVSWGSAADVPVTFVNQSVLGGSTWGLTDFHYYADVKEMADASIQVALYSSTGTPTPVGDIKNVIAHEIGHALGIAGHSTYSTDLMYPVLTMGSAYPATIRDINTAMSAYPGYFGYPTSASQAPQTRGLPVKAAIE